MITSDSVRTDLFKGAKFKLFAVSLLLVMSLAPLASVSALNPEKPMAYAVNGELFYREGLGGTWDQVSLYGDDTGANMVSLGEDGCIVYRAGSGDVYYKASASSTTDTRLISNSLGNIGEYSIDKNCSIAWISLDDAENYITSIWYKATPASTAVEIETANTNYVAQVAVDNAGGVAWADITATLWYNASPTGTPVQVSPDYEAANIEMNGNGNITWQDPSNVVWYKATPTSTAQQLSEPGIAGPNTISMDSSGNVAWSCNTSAIWFTTSAGSAGSKRTTDGTTTRGVVTADGSGYIYETALAGLAYWDLNTNISTPLTGDELFVAAMSIY